MGVEAGDDGIDELPLEVGRIRELLLGVAGRLRLQRLGFHHLVGQSRRERDLVTVGGVTAKQIVEFGYDFGEIGLLLLVYLAAARFAERRERGIGQAGKLHGLLATILEVVVGEHHLGQVNRFALLAKLEKPR